MMSFRSQIFRLVIAATIAMTVLMSGQAPVRADPSSEATLIYDRSSVTLVNSGQVEFDIRFLMFIRDEDFAPVRFEAHSWNIDSLESGDCVQLRSSGVGVGVPDLCHRMIRWFTTTLQETHFWKKEDRGNSFRVVNGSDEVATCEIKAGKCTFLPGDSPHVDGLVLTYDTVSLYINNDATTEVSMERLRLCAVTTTGSIKQPCALMLETGATLDPGGCFVLGPSVDSYELQCASVKVIKPDRIFWKKNFALISPITARTTICPAATPNHPQRCVIPR